MACVQIKSSFQTKKPVTSDTHVVHEVYICYWASWPLF